MRKLWIAIILIISCAGCKVLQPQPKQTAVHHTTDTDSNYTVHIDSVFVFVHDSIYVQKGADTVFYERYKTLFRDRLKVDTLIKIDSFLVDNSRTEIVEVNKLKWWQKTLMWMGVVLTAAMIIVILIKR